MASQTCMMRNTPFEWFAKEQALFLQKGVKNGENIAVLAAAS